MDCSMPGFPVHHHLPEFAQAPVHRVSDAIQPSHPLSSPGSPFPSPGDLPDPGIKPGSMRLQAVSLLSEQPGKSHQRKLLVYLTGLQYAALAQGRRFEKMREREGCRTQILKDLWALRRGSTVGW